MNQPDRAAYFAGPAFDLDDDHDRREPVKEITMFSMRDYVNELRGRSDPQARLAADAIAREVARHEPERTGYAAGKPEELLDLATPTEEAEARRHLDRLEDGWPQLKIARQRGRDAR